VRTGHGDTTASAGAKKKPSPTYQAEPARSDAKTKRSQRGIGASVVVPWRVLVIARLLGLANHGAGTGVTRAITSDVVDPAAAVGQTHSVTAQIQAPPFGTLMRQWRQRRRLSQLDLALEADVSSRHVSFIETGRSAPSRAMVLRLASVLNVPLRERNQLLLAAGLAPVYAERTLDDPDMVAVRAGLDRVLEAYEPYPCLAVDRGWNIVAANTGVAVLLQGVESHLLERPNALRISLHPDGLAPRIRNLGQWRHHVVSRLRREVAVSGSDELAALLAEIDSYPGGFDETSDLGGVVVPLELDGPDGVVLSFLGTVTTFGTALDLTAAELSIEAFLPADEATAAALR
jgi:transcriptional regulator with XRE-family HTH domain